MGFYAFFMVHECHYEEDRTQCSLNEMHNYKHANRFFVQYFSVWVQALLNSIDSVMVIMYIACKNSSKIVQLNNFLNPKIASFSSGMPSNETNNEDIKCILLKMLT